MRDTTHVAETSDCSAPKPDTTLSVGVCATLACLLEVTAAKAGNVHRGADFADMTLADMLVSAAVIAPSMEAAAQRSVGETVLAAVRATQDAVRKNTNLGTILLLAPLAKVPRHVPIRAGVGQVLAGLTIQDSVRAYAAIRAARPGGLGTDSQADVRCEPEITLGEAMALAAPRDLVARQYTNGYQEVLELVVPRLAAGERRGWPLAATIVHTQLQLLAELPDSLIVRKCGLGIAREASARAEVVLRTGGPRNETYREGLADFDFWLRADGNRRNPGTTADLIAAGLFVALRDGPLTRPLHFD